MWIEQYSPSMIDRKLLMGKMQQKNLTNLVTCDLITKDKKALMHYFKFFKGGVIWNPKHGNQYVKLLNVNVTQM